MMAIDTTKLTPEWLAGFFDGEGCVCLQMQHGYVRLRINITQADKELLEAIASIYNADYLYVKPRKNNDSLVYEIGWYGKSCANILNVLNGRVVKKQAQVDLALRFLDTLVGSGNRLTDEQLAERESLRQHMRKLNYVGPKKPNAQVVDSKEFVQ